MPDLGFLGWDLKIILSYFKPTLSNLSNCKICGKTKQKTKFGTKNALFGYYYVKISKLCCHIWNQHPQICLTSKYREIIKMHQKWLIWVFLGCIWKQYCHIWNQHHRICLIGKYREIMKIPKFGRKNALFGYFCAAIWKQCCHIWNRHPRFHLIANIFQRNNNV